MSVLIQTLWRSLFVLMLLCWNVEGHAWLSNPKPRGQYETPAKAAWQEYQPASTNPNDPMIVCRNDTVMPKASWFSLQAGATQSITISFSALHVGDCFFYLSYDGDKPMSEMKWFKIWQQHSCKDNSNYNIPIPSYLPSGDHVVMRWEWYALHQYPTVEYYAQCVDATITGSSSGALPYPQVTMPGHLPVLSGSYADGTNNYWWPYGNQAMFFTGPALATLNGNSATPAPTASPTPAPTSRPTSAPVTASPTTRPTSAPVTPSPTSRPTNVPATIKPTPQPTAAPINPTSSPATMPPIVPTPPIRPTAIAPVAPTTRPITPTAMPTNTVKLNVLAASSAWWFAVEISGDGSNQVASIQFTDSGVYGSGMLMNYGWATVWTFAPGVDPITFPVTIRASLASGSSVRFTVNRLPITTIDSGSVFA